MRILNTILRYAIENSTIRGVNTVIYERISINLQNLLRILLFYFIFPFKTIFIAVCGFIKYSIGLILNVNASPTVKYLIIDILNHSSMFLYDKFGNYSTIYTIITVIFILPAIRAVWRSSQFFTDTMVLGSIGSLLIGIFKAIKYDRSLNDSSRIGSETILLYHPPDNHFLITTIILFYIFLGRGIIEWLGEKKVGKLSDETEIEEYSVIDENIDHSNGTNSMNQQRHIEITNENRKTPNLIKTTMPQPGQLVFLRGETRIFFDGIVLMGHGIVDEATVTGEGLAVEKWGIKGDQEETDYDQILINICDTNDAISDMKNKSLENEISPKQASKCHRNNRMPIEDNQYNSSHFYVRSGTRLLSGTLVIRVTGISPINSLEMLNENVSEKKKVRMLMLFVVFIIVLYCFLMIISQIINNILNDTNSFHQIILIQVGRINLLDILENALSLLILACPCALVLVEPLSLILLQRKSRNVRINRRPSTNERKNNHMGVTDGDLEELLRDSKINYMKMTGLQLENAYHKNEGLFDCIVLDKTGTITHGKMAIGDMEIIKGYY